MGLQCNQGAFDGIFFNLKPAKKHHTLLRFVQGFTAAKCTLIHIVGCLLTCFISLNASAYTLTWPSSDDPTWEYTATLSNESIKKVGTAHEGSTLQAAGVAGSALSCTKGSSNLYHGNLFVWCKFYSGDSYITSATAKPYAHWFYVDQPQPVDPYWSGTVLSLSPFTGKYTFGREFINDTLPIPTAIETDKLTYLRIWRDSRAPWAKREGWFTTYLSLAFIEADMFGKKSHVQSTLKQRMHMTDPVITSATCCDTGIYELSLAYDITLKRHPLLITLPSYVDMGELIVGSNSESKRIGFSLSANNQPVAITAGIANLSFEQVKGVSSSAGCSASVQVSNEQGPINRGERVDLYSFYNGTDYGIKAQILNTDGCVPGDHEEVLSFTVAWQ